MHFLSVSLSLLAVLSTSAAPTETDPESGQIWTLLAEDVATFKPYSYYAASAYCYPSTLADWTCGENCEENPRFKPVAAGGDGALVQYWYVGFDPSLHTIIVGHQGTDRAKIIPFITDANLVLSPLNPTLFPDVGSDVWVHSGFSMAHGSAATHVLSAVKTAMAKYGTNDTATVGHSLGAAISLLDALYLKLQIPHSRVRFYGYGLPRVGNQAFANLVNSKLDSFIRITNRKDPVPIVPDTSLSYMHPSWEAHINDGGSWKACPGRENTDKQCTDGEVPNVAAGNLADHSGPYGDVMMTC